MLGQPSPLRRAGRILLVALLLATTLLAGIGGPEPVDGSTITGLTLKGYVNTGGGLNLRSKPSTSAPVIRELDYGKRMVILGTSADWFKVSVSGKTGYVSSWYITVIGASSNAIYRGNTGRKMVALTFDAGSDLGHTERIITILEEYGVVASFGLTGTWMEAYPDYAAWIAADGHQIINHTLSHLSFTGASTGADPISPARRLSQLIDNEARLAKLTGASSKPYWRPPFGDIDSGVLREIGAIGYRRTVMWSIDSMGWNRYTANQVYARVVNNIGNGSIVLMHVGGASSDAATLERIIETLRARGYSFGTVAQVIA